MRIEEICKEKNITYKQLADDAGMLPEAVSRLAAGKTNPTLSTLSTIAAALGVEVVDLFEKREEVRVFVEHQGERREITAKDIIRLMEEPKMPDENKKE